MPASARTGVQLRLLYIFSASLVATTVGFVWFLLRESQTDPTRLGAIVALIALGVPLVWATLMALAPSNRTRLRWVSWFTAASVVVCLVSLYQLMAQQRRDAQIAYAQAADPKLSPLVKAAVVGGGGQSLPTIDERSATLADDLMVMFPLDVSACEQNDLAAEACPKPDDGMNLTDQVHHLLLVDASSSMREPWGSFSRFEQVLDVLDAHIDTLPSRVQVGVRVFGQEGTDAAADKERSCLSSRLVRPFAIASTSMVSRALVGSGPMGWSPLADALVYAFDDFRRFGGEQHSNFVYLVVDGADNCGGDAVAAATRLVESDARVKLRVFAIDVNAQARRDLQAIADAAGSALTVVESPSQLRAQLVENSDWHAWRERDRCVARVLQSQSLEIATQARQAVDCAITERDRVRGLIDAELVNRLQTAEWDPELTAPAVDSLVTRNHDEALRPILDRYDERNAASVEAINAALEQVE